MSDDSPQANDSNIQVRRGRPPKLDLTAGLENGDEVVDIFGEKTGEKIVHDTDDAGAATGWHKQVKRKRG